MKLFIILMSILSTQGFSEEVTSCPFATATYKDDQEVLGELQNYFKSFSNNPACTQVSNDGMKTVAELQVAMDSAKQSDPKDPPSQSIQDKVTKGMDSLQSTIAQTFSLDNLCGPQMKDAIKMAMGVFSKVKALSPATPWGAAAGLGADLANAAIDNAFPSDAVRAASAMDKMLSDDSYEQIACLYFTIQQKMYCADHPVNVVSPDPKCNPEVPGSDLVKLLENVHDIKNAIDLVASPKGFPVSSDQVNINFLEEKIDDLIKYATASEPEVRERIKTLPKIQQAQEVEKINRFYQLLNQYQYSNVETPEGVEVGRLALEHILPLLYSPDSSIKINFEQLVFKSTPSLSMDAINQRGLVRALEDLQNGGSEEGRRIIRLNKYKSTMNKMAPAEMKEQLEKNFDELTKQLKTFGNDVTSEGMLRNVVRHCVLMQEVYDPQFEGKIPSQCAKLNCGKENRLNWFMPKEGANNLAKFKKSYCEKSLDYKKIEDQYINDLRDSAGAKICGIKIADFIDAAN